ncbi:MAG: GNAT family N-acetyltransferase [Candidatus Hodarchaeota archaeon]
MGDLFRLKRSQVDATAKVLARAFEHDPLHMYYFPDPTTRVQQNYHVMKYCIRFSMMFGEVYTTSPRLEGIALWQLKDPVEELNKPRSLFTNWLTFRLEIALGEAVEKIYSIYEIMMSTQFELIPSPHWYFFIIGIDPNFKRKGYASRLIKPMLSRIKREQLPCYLDTNNEENVGLYQHYGFKVLKEYQFPGTNVINWSMLRE